MTVPADWPKKKKECQDFVEQLKKDIIAQKNARKQLDELEKQFEQRRRFVCAQVGYDLDKGGGGDLLKLAENAMQKDTQLKTISKQMVAFEKQSEPVDAPPGLKAALAEYQKMLDAPSLNLPGVPKDIIKAHKEGTAFIKETRTTYKSNL